MGNGRKGTDDGRTATRSAAEWFALKESDRELDRAIVLEWEKWRSNPRNRAEYAKFAQLRQDLRMLSTPSRPSRDALVADAAADPDAAIRPPG